MMGPPKPSRLSNTYTSGADDDLEFEDDEERHRFQLSKSKPTSKGTLKGKEDKNEVEQDEKDDDDEEDNDDEGELFQVPLSNEVMLKGPTKVCCFNFLCEGSFLRAEYLLSNLNLFII
jgi:hypothetical protein